MSVVLKSWSICLVIPLVEGSLWSANLALYERLAPVEWEIKARIISAPLAHFDETGMRVQGKTHWCHASSTDKLTHYFIHHKRGQEAMDKAGILPKFQGTALHDAWASYFQYEECHHALCNAHTLAGAHFRVGAGKAILGQSHD